LSTEAGRVVILMYHIVDRPRNATEANFCCTPDRFAKQMQHIATSGLMLMDLEDVSDCLSGTRAWPSKGVAVTLDDGYRCAHETALPILERSGVPATVFVVAGRVGETNDWVQRRKAPVRELLSWAELRHMSDRGISVGSHTLTHPRLPEVTPGELSRELEDSRRMLEDGIGCPVTQFAYPFGQYNDVVRDAMERAGYRAACSAQPGFNGPGVDPFALRRIDVYGQDTLSMFKQKLNFGMNRASLLFPLRYYGGRVLSRIGFSRRAS
jgi:peptidoglycan/xylan/chitin deacetylase (PgdA/CDA1 family)